MAIGSPLTPAAPPEGPGVDVGLPEEPTPGVTTTTLDDGTVLLDYEEAAAAGEAPDFKANLAEHLDPGELTKIGGELVTLFEEDKNSRAEWEKAYIKGLKLLGFKIEDRMEPWPNACGVYHPILSEAVVRFQSQAIMELFPASGPVKTRIVGEQSDFRMGQAKRVEEYMNYMLTVRMREYRAEHEQMLFYLAIAGSAFKKVYLDYILGRPAAMFVPAEDFVVSYATTDLGVSPRYTHVQRRTKNDLTKLMVAGFYRETELGDAPARGTSGTQDIQQEYDKLQGFTPNVQGDKRFTVLEMYVDLDLEGFEDIDQHGEKTGIELPYVVTIEKDSKQVLSIRRNFSQEDPLKTKRDHFVHYRYVPGLGFYGFGLIHLIGGITKSATSVLRQLVDAGTLANLPGGFKARGLRIKSDDSPISPGEWRDVDVPGQAIKDNILPLPYKEPSAVLQSLMNQVVDEGRRFASIADLDVGEGNQQAPVGTTLALIERSMKVMSAIHARLHASQSFEFTLLADLIQDYTPETYEYDVPGGRQIKKTDFDDRIDIIPVSDPNATSFAQRLLTQQTALQVAATAPQLYNMRILHRQLMETLGVDDVDKVIPDPTQLPPQDPLSENAEALMGHPVKAYDYQNHAAHIATHQAILADPSLQQNPTFQQTAAIMMSHIAEHTAMQYRAEVAQALGINLPPMGQPMPPQIEAQLAPRIAQAVQMITGQHQKLFQAQQAAQMAQNPEIQIKQQEVQIKAAEVQRKTKENQARTLVDLAKVRQRAQGERERLATQERIAMRKDATALAKPVEARDRIAQEERIAAQDRASKERIEGAKVAASLVIPTIRAKEKPDAKKP